MISDAFFLGVNIYIYICLPYSLRTHLIYHTGGLCSQPTVQPEQTVLNSTSHSVVKVFIISALSLRVLDSVVEIWTSLRLLTRFSMSKQNYIDAIITVPRVDDDKLKVEHGQSKGN